MQTAHMTPTYRYFKTNQQMITKEHPIFFYSTINETSMAYHYVQAYTRIEHLVEPESVSVWTPCKFCKTIGCPFPANIPNFKKNVHMCTSVCLRQCDLLSYLINKRCWYHFQGFISISIYSHIQWKRDIFLRCIQLWIQEFNKFFKLQYYIPVCCLLYLDCGYNTLIQLGAHKARGN